MLWLNMATVNKKQKSTVFTAQHIFRRKPNTLHQMCEYRFISKDLLQTRSWTEVATVTHPADHIFSSRPQSSIPRLTNSRVFTKPTSWNSHHLFWVVCFIISLALKSYCQSTSYLCSVTLFFLHSAKNSVLLVTV